VADVADPVAVDLAAQRIVDAFGGVDIWINNAMATVFAPLSEITPEEVKRVIEVTYLGQVHGTLTALKLMRPRDCGTIVQVGSALAYRSIPLQAAYCAAKFAVRGFTDALRCELLHEGSRVRVTMVQLPAVNTPQFDWARSRLPRRLQPVPPIYTAESVADAIFRAAEDAPRELWIGRSAIQAIVGALAVPALLDRIVAKKAWTGQMTDEPARPRSDNLFAPPSGDPGSSGRFGDRSRRKVVALHEGRVRVFAATLGLAAVGAATGFVFSMLRRGGGRRVGAARYVRKRGEG
jgi:NAD(P)-dependent dehydrogenase (short-subunit alcohol dehydrogenase family)